MFDAEGIETLLLDKIIDTQFAQLIESKREGVHFLRVDAELADSMKGEGAAEIPGVTDLFKKLVPEQTEIKFEALKDTSVPAILNVSEDSRRMEDMMKMYSVMGQNAPASFPTQATLILNTSNELIASLADADKEKADLISKQIYTLCLLSQRRLSPEELRQFLTDSYNILGKL